MGSEMCIRDSIETIAKSGAVVIAGGGGGIPVVRNDDGTRHGVEAVIDKDLSSALMANVLGIDTMMVLTAVDRVYVDFGKPTQRALNHLSLAEIEELQDRGEFADGSMGPKIAAAIQFVRGGGKRAIIAHLDEAEAALAGTTGTQITT